MEITHHDSPHFLGFPISYPPVNESDDRCWWNGLYGMTDKSIQELVTVARSWAEAPELSIQGRGYTSQGYDRGERAYKLIRVESSGNRDLRVHLAGSENSPVFNPAFVIENWGDGEAVFSIDGKTLSRGKDVRIGHRHELEGVDLIVWIKHESTRSVEIKMSHVK